MEGRGRRSSGAETTQEEGEQVLLRIGGGQVHLDAAGGFLDPGSDFQETSAQGLDLEVVPGSPHR